MLAVRIFFRGNLLQRPVTSLTSSVLIRLQRVHLSSLTVGAAFGRSTISQASFNLSKCCTIHTLGISYAADKRQVNKQSSSNKKDESVLMQVFSKKEQSKQLTVGAKGKNCMKQIICCNIALGCYLHNCIIDKTT